MMNFRKLCCMAICFLLSGCFIKTSEQIISSDKAVNPWSGYTTVMFSAAENNTFDLKPDMVLTIFDDNSIAVDELLFRMAKSEMLSLLTGTDIYLTTIPRKKDTILGVDFSPNPEEYFVLAFAINENGDVSDFTLSGMCAENVSSFEEAEESFAECHEAGRTSFNPMLTFKEGLSD